MRYLKKYNIFESSDFDELEEELRDIFIDFSDNGFDVLIKNTKSNFSPDISFCATYTVSIFDGTLPALKHKKKTFKISDVINSILTSGDYMSDNGWSINKIDYYSGTSFTKGVGDGIKWGSLELNKLDNINPSVLNKDINYINIQFKKFINEKRKGIKK